MKRFAASIVILCIAALTACTVQTITITPPDTYQYIVYLDTAYMEISDGTFEHDGAAILVDFQADRTVFTASFTEATVTVFADGSLSAVYLGGWNATCPAGAPVDDCSFSAPDTRRSEEVSSLLDFRNVVVLTGEYTPYDEFPIVFPIISWKILMTIVLGLVVVYQALVILLPRGVRGIFHPSRTLQIGKYISSRSRSGDHIMHYWNNAAAAVSTVSEDFEARYGPRSGTPDTIPAPTFRDRLRTRWPRLFIAVLLFGLVLAASILW